VDSNAAITTVQTTGGLDVTSAQALELLNAAYTDVVAGSMWRRAEFSLGNTVASTYVYTLDDSQVVSVRALTVAGKPYTLTSTEHLWNVKNGDETSNVLYGLYAEEFTAAGGAQVAIDPTPATSGDAIKVLAALEPVALDTGSNTAIITPPDTHQRIVSAAILLGRARLLGDGNALQLYQQLTDVNQAGSITQELSTRRNAEVGGSGVQTIDMSGI
jgi:hypothetical protein